MKTYATFLLATLALVGPGCSDSTDCAADADCYAMETCQDGSCVIGGNNGSSNNGSSNNGSSNNGSSNNGNNGASNNGESNNGNNGASNNGGSNTNTNNTNNNTNNTNNGTNGELACIVDQFSSCEDLFEVGDRNDSWTDASRLQSSAGCVFQRDEFIPRTVTADGTLCHLESADWYAQTVVPCDNITIVATARLHPKTLCLPEDYEFSFRRSTGEMDCTMAGVSCTMEGEDRLIRWLVPPESSVLSFYADIQPAAEDRYINLDYTITLSVSGP